MNDEEVVELGAVSEETKGQVNGLFHEQSILPWTNCRPGTPGCPGG